MNAINAPPATAPSLANEPVAIAAAPVEEDEAAAEAELAELAEDALREADAAVPDEELSAELAEIVL